MKSNYLSFPARGRFHPGPALPLMVAALALATPTVAQHDSVIGTVHNLSVSGPGEIRSLTETEVCKFCHIPHNAVVPQPLWGHALSSSQYELPAIRSGRLAGEALPQPDGSSRLCLSCHDGTVALGDIAGEASPIPMSGAERLGPGRRGFIGTDLSGSHPISFVVPDAGVRDERFQDDGDMILRPLSAIGADAEVRLDGAGKMQCTTCHDPHSDRNFVPDQVPHFWVKSSVNEVCLTCHAPL